MFEKSGTKCQVAVIYGRNRKKKVEIASLPKQSCPGKQGSRGLSKAWSPSWWYMPVILALQRLKQANEELEASLGHKPGPVK